LPTTVVPDKAIDLPGEFDLGMNVILEVNHCSFFRNTGKDWVNANVMRKDGQAE
jgi:2',3'-cyclic-nucleotide 2'-phosphodiesterase (5'-nucleotidase family)